MEKRPNILLITCDHLRGDLLGCAGHPVIQTPHINQLAYNGVRFTNAYSTTPICTPARATIMTGLHGYSMGLTEFKKIELPVRETLPQLLSDAGYQTKVVGKMHVYPERCHYGFHDMILCEEGRLLGKSSGQNGKYDDYEQWLAEQGYPGMAYGHGLSLNEYAVTPWHLPNHLHPTEWIGYQTCKEIKRRDWTRPLFLWASFTAPHPPITPLLNDLYVYERVEIPKPVVGDWAHDQPAFHQVNKSFGRDMTDDQIELAIRGFYASVTQIDRQINRIIGTLNEEGMLENTWIIFTSDHGDNLGDHYLWQKSNFLKGSTNIPFIITPPFQKNPSRTETYKLGSVNNSVIGLQDILPTCLDIAGVPIPIHVDGKSLLPIVRNSAESVRDVILGEFGPIGRRSLMLTDGVWKYIWYEEDNYELLFNIQEDPNELRNLSFKCPVIRDEWKSKLIQVLSERKYDPAIKNKMLNASNPGYKLDDTEIYKRINSLHLYNNPKGLH